MKKIIFLAFIMVSFSGISQNIKRVNVHGSIIVESNDISGITILNKTSNALAVTDENGKFVISVGLNDAIEVSALQFQNVNFEVNSDIIKSKSMRIFLIEEINKLEEIVISSKKLSGILEKDIIAASNFSPKLDALYFGIKTDKLSRFETADMPSVTNIALTSQSQSMINGLNVVNIVDQLLLPLFRSELKNKKVSGIPEVPAEAIKHYFGSEFLHDNFGIPKHRTEEFIRFVEHENFDFSLLNYGKEMEFLQVIHDKSVLFLQKK